VGLIDALVARQLKLPDSRTYSVTRRKNLAVPMPDGVTLLADYHSPARQ